MDNTENKCGQFPVRVAHIMGKLWAGGVENVVFNYYREIDKKQIQFDFYYDSDSTVEPPQDLIDLGARFIEIPPYQHLPQYLKTLRKYFKNNDYKIVHSHINTLSVFPLFAAWMEGIPVRIAHNHSVPAGNEVRRNLLKYFLRMFAKVFATDYFACSEKAGRWLFGDRAYNNNKVVLIKNAIRLEDFVLSNPEIEAKKKALSLDGKLVIGHVGRFTYAKNHLFLLNVFSEIIKLRDDAVLLLVGDGELREQILAQIDKLKLNKYVVLTGKVSDPYKYYGLMDVLVLPSIFEGLSLTTIEAQAAGIPVVVSESVPEEAVISNACKHMKLECSETEWAREVMRMIGARCELTEESDAYNIERATPRIQEWYIKKALE